MWEVQRRAVGALRTAKRTSKGFRITLGAAVSMPGVIADAPAAKAPKPTKNQQRRAKEKLKKREVSPHACILDR